MANGASEMRAPRNVLIIAMANKLARIAWAASQRDRITDLFRTHWQHKRAHIQFSPKVCTGRVKMKEQSQRRA